MFENCKSSRVYVTATATQETNPQWYLSNSLSLSIESERAIAEVYHHQSKWLLRVDYQTSSSLTRIIRLESVDTGITAGIVIQRLTDLTMLLFDLVAHEDRPCEYHGSVNIP